MTLINIDNVNNYDVNKYNKFSGLNKHVTDVHGNKFIVVL